MEESSAQQTDLTKRAKALNKQHQQEESEAEAQEIKAKNKKSSLGGLAVAAGE